jgi:hypothetical protein
MTTNRGDLPGLRRGEQPVVETGSAEPVVADTFAGRVHVEWAMGAKVAPLGQLPFFIDYLKQGELFDGWVADAPLHYTTPNAPKKRDVLGTVLLSVLAGHWRYATYPPLLGMERAVSEDAVRRFDKIDEDASITRLQDHLDYGTPPLHSRCRHQSQAALRASGRCQSELQSAQTGAALAQLSQLPAGEPAARFGGRGGDGHEHTSKRSAPGLWKLLDGQAAEHKPVLMRGDANFGNEPVMREAEQHCSNRG